MRAINYKTYTFMNNCKGNVTDTPRTDACPHCGDKQDADKFYKYECGTLQQFPSGTIRTELCHQTEVSNIWMKRANKAEAEVKKIKTEYWFMEEVMKKEIAAMNEELCEAGLREYGN